RNIRRNIRRTLITLGAVCVGLAAIILFFGFNNGFHESWLAQTLKLQSGHVVINAPGYRDDPKLSNYMEDPEPAFSALDKAEGITAYAPRVDAHGLVSTAENSVGVLIRGIDLEREKDLTGVNERIVEGEGLTGESGGIILGFRLAKKLNATIGDKVVLMIQAADGSIGAELYRLKGTFKLGMMEMDGSIAVISIDDARELAVIGTGVTEIAALSSDPRAVDPIVDSLSATLSKEAFDVVSWEVALGALMELMQLDYVFMYFLLAIVLVIVSLGIVNTMLMSILERTRELGIMMALGTSPRVIVFLIVLESLVIAVIGTLAGVALGIGANELIAINGLDLSRWSEGFEMFAAIDPVVYPINDYIHVFYSSLAVFFTTVIVSLYPAIKAARLKPVEAIHFV
ncbi:MAG: ABC transporter permease, partial [Deltaproteobacteria bacterium]|nr:ABC transporter permease [Deltaproteobacteria bacterium]